ncbi:hypothetical protein Tco_0229882, partial [Tanacetum coccineum]
YYLELERMMQAQLGHGKGYASCHLLIGCKLVVSNDVVVNLDMEKMMQAQLGHGKGYASCHLLIGCKLVVSNDV